jgi:hypothetical protein
MRSKDARFAFVAVAVLLALSLVTLVGCAEVEVVDATPSASGSDLPAGVVPEGSGEHNLAVLAVEFDPPLEYEKLIVRRQAVTLLVAIENTGTQNEHDVVVLAQLSTPENREFVLIRETSVASIAPGEVQIARFPELSKIPYYETYHLEVIVKPVDGEADFADNGRAFDIQIHRE